MTKNENDKCDVLCVNFESVKKVQENTLDCETLASMSEIFKVLGDPGRVKIVHYLSKSELCVCDLAQLLSMSVSAVSHQLRILRDKRLVKYRREGKIVYYSLDDNHIVSMLNQCLDHVSHH